MKSIPRRAKITQWMKTSGDLIEGLERKETRLKETSIHRKSSTMTVDGSTTSARWCHRVPVTKYDANLMGRGWPGSAQPKFRRGDLVGCNIRNHPQNIRMPLSADVCTPLAQRPSVVRLQFSRDKQRSSTVSFAFFPATSTATSAIGGLDSFARSCFFRWRQLYC